MGNWWRDLKYGLRMLARNKGFTTVAVLALALGIGPNVAMFSVIWAMFLAPLPYQQPDQLVMIWMKIKGERNPLRADDFLQYEKQSTSFQGMYFTPWAEVHLTNSDHTEDEISGNYASPESYSKGLRVDMALGRDFLPEEGIPGNDHEVILTHRLWMERYHSDPNILGKQILVDNQSYTVVGVHEPGVPDRQNSQFQIPTSVNPTHDPRWVGVLGRLKPGVTLAQAQAELSVIDKRIADKRSHDLNSADAAAWTVSVEPLKNDWLDKRLMRNLWLLFAAVGFVLLIACANVANLLLSRGASRQKEIAIRSSLGATRRQIFTQLVTESLTLALLGGMIGVGMGWALIKFIVALIPDYTLYTENLIRMDLPILFFAFGVTSLGGVLFGCAPAWHTAKLNLSETLKQGSQSVLGGKKIKTQASLVIAEYALAIALLAGAGMALHSFWKITRIDLGMRPDNVWTGLLRAPAKDLTNLDQTRTDAMQVLQTVRNLPGVKNAAIGSFIPLQGSDTFYFSIAGRPVSETDHPVADLETVTAGYFDTYGIRLSHGRFLNDSDNASGAQAVMVNESFVRRYFPNVDPLEQSLMLPNLLPGQKFGTPTSWQIVGIFKDVTNGEHISDTVTPQIFCSYWQMPWRRTALAIRTNEDPGLITNSVRQALSAAGNGIVIRHAQTMKFIVDDQLRNDRFGMALFASFAALALLLAAVGIYGVMAFAVAQRKHEIGLRMALGAQKQDVVNLILGNGIKLALLGAGIGLIGVYIVGRLMRSILYGIDTVDFTSFAAVAFVLLLTAVIASYIPARRSAKVDPMVALRQE